MLRLQRGRCAINNSAQIDHDRFELGEALHRTAALARQRSAVIVVSDFRGPLDWRRPLLELAGGRVLAQLDHEAAGRGVTPLPA